MCRLAVLPKQKILIRDGQFRICHSQPWLKFKYLPSAWVVVEGLGDIQGFPVSFFLVVPPAFVPCDWIKAVVCCALISFVFQTGFASEKWHLKREPQPSIQIDALGNLAWAVIVPVPWPGTQKAFKLMSSSHAKFPMVAVLFHKTCMIAIKVFYYFFLC